MIDATTSLTDVAFKVCTALDAVGHKVVLVGGSAATYYAPEAYQSHDLDFVMELQGKGSKAALAKLGFELNGSIYRHRKSTYSLDFLNGPLAVGNDERIKSTTVRRRGQLLHVISPFDSCRDRLLWYLHDNDFSGLDQAEAVYRACKSEIDLDALGTWCTREGHTSKFELIKARFDVVS